MAQRSMLRGWLAPGAALAVAACAGLPAAPATAAVAALPQVTTAVETVALADIGAHRGVTVTARCAPGSTLVGGGSYLRRASDPEAIPTNGLVLGGTTASTGASPVDLAVADGAVDPASWLSIANYTGVSEAGNQASTFALCATGGGPARTVVRTATRTGTVAAQELSPPHLATATCPAGARLIGGGAATSTPDQLNDGVTVGNNGNLKPLGSYPSDAAGAAAADGSDDADSWSAYGSAGITAATDRVTAFALCSTDPATPPVAVARADVDGPDAQPGTTPTTATATCAVGTRLLGGGYRVDETVAGVGSGLQPQQGYHMRASLPGTQLDPAGDGDANPGSWTALVQAGGQRLGAGKHMTTRAFAMCATPPPAGADLSLTLAAAPDPVLVGGTLDVALTVRNDGPADAADVELTLALPAGTTFAAAPAACAHAAGVVTCALATIAAGDDAAVTVRVAVDAALTLRASAAVTSTTPDPDGDDNAATAQATAQQPVRATPALTGQAAATAVLGEALTDTATLTGGASPTGSIAFDLYGPLDGACTIPIATSTAPVSGDGTYSSAGHATGAAGTYRWIARYGGDGANEPAATPCGDAAQTVSVKAAPQLTLRSSPATTAGGAIAADATLAGGTLLTGTITFRLHGPGDDGCATALRTTSASVAGNGIYGAPPYTATTPGTYRWVADYGGDAHNRPAGPTACAEPLAAVAVRAAAGPSPGPPSRPPPPAARPPSSAFAIAGARADGRGRIGLLLRSASAGRFTVVATARRGRASMRFGGGRARARAGALVRLTIAPGLRARVALRRGRLRVRVAVTFRPAGGAARTRVRQVAVRGGS